MWVHLYDPHDPYEPPAPFSETYKDHLYDGEIAYADSALANFLAYVKKQGWYDNALVIVVGDHGEGLGEHHENTHGIFLYDSTTHVPLIVKLPAKSNAGKVVDSQVRTMDIVPTALDLLHAPIPGGLDGASLKPYFAGDTTNRTAYGETDYPLRFGWAPLRSVRADGFKLIQAPRPELYDLHADPGELKNTYAAGNSRVVKYQQLLAVVYSKAPTETASDGAASESAKNDLKALGYGAANISGAANSANLPDPKDKIEEQNLLHTAMMASDDNRSAAARTALEQVLQLDPKSPTALRQLGELELQAGDYPKAADHLKRAREVRPEDATAAFYEGQARNKIEDFAGARDALEASLKLTPGQAEARLLLGDVYLSLKDPKAAEDQFEAAQLLDSNSVAAQVGSARAQIVEGNYAAAIEQLAPLAKSHPDDAQVFDALSKAYAGMGKVAEAQEAADRAKLLNKK